LARGEKGEEKGRSLATLGMKIVGVGRGIIAMSLCESPSGKDVHDISCPYIGRSAMSERDPFTGTWKFCAEKSDAAGVRSWVQWIEVVGEEIRVREEVESAAGARANVSIEARFDGKDYAVRGSSMVDAIAYTRVDRHNIAGVGKKNGSVTLRETITAPEVEGGVLTLTFAIFSGEREVMSGVAVFENEVASGE
jgi:hypothetical protein